MQSRLIRKEICLQVYPKGMKFSARAEGKCFICRQLRSNKRIKLSRNPFTLQQMKVRNLSETMIGKNRTIYIKPALALCKGVDPAKYESQVSSQVFSATTSLSMA